LPVTPPDDAGGENAAQLLARCRQLEQCLRLHQAVSRCLAETNDADEALALLVETLPQDLGWAGATLWRRNAAGQPVAERGWPDRAASASPAAALAANAFSSGAPVWSANGCDGRAGFAIPAHSDGGTVAAITCVSHREAPHNDEFNEFARQLYLSTGQLARYMARQRQKERLTRLTSELTAIFQLSADGFVAFNDKGTLSYLNTAFARMIGVDRDDLRGITEAEFERRLAALLDPVQTAAAGGSDQVIRLSQPRSTVLQRSRREARDIEGRLIGRLLYFRDITLETELLRANGEFLSNAAHELRTPMASIHGFIELLLKRDFAPEKRRSVLETIHSQSSRLSEIVDELLEVARFDARAARDLDCSVQPLVPIIEATVGELLVRNDARAVELALPGAADSPLVRIDRGRFVQALTNVLSNAYKYSPNGGAIELALRQRTRSDQDWIGVAVRDHGIGMSEAELQHVFERFFRARPAGSIPGTGLGMSMVKKIIDAHGGVVEVTSAPGEGTEVTLWLPVHGRPEAVPDGSVPA
jgi:PAS domain S-box-containing protein